MSYPGTAVSAEELVRLGFVRSRFRCDLAESYFRKATGLRNPNWQAPPFLLNLKIRTQQGRTALILELGA